MIPAIQPGVGCWNVTRYPFGGCFYRVGPEPLPVHNVRTCPKPGWVYVAADALPGSTCPVSGEQTLCVQSQYLCNLEPVSNLTPL